MVQIWVVEDNPKIGAHIISLFRDEGYAVTGMVSAEQAQSRMSDPDTAAPDLVLLDIRLGTMSGLDLIHHWGPDLLPPTIVISGEATISEALEAMSLGVHDFIEKPFSDERLLYAVRNCLERLDLREKVRQLERRVRGGKPIIGEAEATRTMLGLIDKVAPTNGRVLITGESGTGKELVASMLHARSKRHKGPFVKINCASFPVHLIEDELFGHVRGAFTDARVDKKGLFEEAHGGTLFLDEIGDMDYSLQARLLRVLEDGVVRRVGDSRERQVDVRVLAATNCELEEMVAKNSFREDLYYRLATIPIAVPPLRDRIEDIPILLTYYVDLFCKEHGFRAKKIATEVFDLLRAYNWPGNVRELRNLAERLVIFGADPIGSETLPSHIFKGDSRQASGLVRLSEVPGMPLKAFKNQCEKEFIETMLHRTNWNYVKVAETLEINRSYLHQKITALGIERKPGST